jgi:hypothetical protein
MNISRSGMVTFLAVLGVLAGVTAAHAAAGGLDQTFGSGGGTVNGWWSGTGSKLSTFRFSGLRTVVYWGP